MDPMTPVVAPQTAARWGWRILVALSALLILNGVALYLVIVDTHVERTIGLLLTIVGILALVVTLDGSRRGSELAWQTTWILAVGLAALGLHSLRGDRADIPIFYLGLAAIALVALLLARPARSATR